LYGTYGTTLTGTVPAKGSIFITYVAYSNVSVASALLNDTSTASTSSLSLAAVALSSTTISLCIPVNMVTGPNQGHKYEKEVDKF
jgi:hypothetical protein